MDIKIGAVIAVLVLGGAVFLWGADKPEAGALPATTTDGAQLDARQAAVLQKIVDACPGLQRYRSDWMPVKVEAESGNAEIELAQPLKEMPFNYHATGHHCFFEVGGARADRVAAIKRPCISACLDKPSDAPTSTWIDIR